MAQSTENNTDFPFPFSIDGTSISDVWGEGLSLCCACGEADPPEDDDMVVSWVICEACERWFHSSCIGWHEEEEEEDGQFFCDQCHEF